MKTLSILTLLMLATPSAWAVCGKAKPDGSYKCCEEGDDGETQCCRFDGSDEPLSCDTLDPHHHQPDCQPDPTDPYAKCDPVIVHHG